MFELHNGHSLASDETETKNEMLSKNQVMIAAHYNIAIGNVEKLVPNVTDKENYVVHFESLQLFSVTSEKNYRVIELNKSHWLIQYIKFKTQKGIETEKN